MESLSKRRRGSRPISLFWLTPIETSGGWHHVTDSLMQSGEFDVDHFHVMSISYRSLVRPFRSKTAVKREADVFRKEVTRLTVTNPDNEIGIIAVGLGGQIVKTALVENADLYNNLSRQMRFIIFVAPVTGHTTALGRWLTGSGTDMSLEERWRALAERSPFQSVYLLGARDEVARYSPFEQWDSRNVYVVPYGHSDMLSGHGLASIIAKVLDRQRESPYPG